MLSADLVRNHLAYTAWASRRLVDAAAALPPEQLTRDFQTADHSVLGTLVHTFAADRIWLARVNGLSPAPFVSEADHQLSVLQNDWPVVDAGWQQWAARLTDASVTGMLDYKDTKGNPYRSPVWQVVLHVVNHGTHHRGLVSGFLRAMGHTPPPLDLIFFYREQAAHA